MRKDNLYTKTGIVNNLIVIEYIENYNDDSNIEYNKKIQDVLITWNCQSLPL